MNKNYGRFITRQDSFQVFPGQPIAYWVSKSLLKFFRSGRKINEFCEVKAGMASSDNDRFLRFWHEVSNVKISYSTKSIDETKKSIYKWFPYNKGGGYRKWFGFLEYVINWENDGKEIKEWVISNPKDPNTTHWSRRIVNTELFFKECFTWGDVTSGETSFRYLPSGFVIGNRGPGIFSDNLKYELLGYLNSNVSGKIFNILNPTLTLNVGNVADTPFLEMTNSSDPCDLINKAIKISKEDWDARETSWSFSSQPLLMHEFKQKNISDTYSAICKYWNSQTKNLKQLEEQINQAFIADYELHGEINPEVSIGDVSLTSNPYYRYGGNKTEAELEAQLQEDTTKEFISYAVGCMFGRYSLEKPGLILATQGESLEDYVQRVEKDKSLISFLPDDDAIIPVLNGEWFEDDAVALVREFLRVTFGNETLETNLRWLEESIGKNLRAYFCANTGGFYDHHLKTYKKRPIYWMFQSPKKHFRALVYLHRYSKDTVNRVLDGYLREFMHKLRSRMEHLDHVLASDSTPTREATQARREKDQIIAALRDCEEYEREILLPLAQQRIELDLDDGVKVNYNKLGNALAKVTGLSE